MLKKSAVFLLRYPKTQKLLRASDQVRSRGSHSYLHNPGSEPLVYMTAGEAFARTVDRIPGRLALRSVHEDLSLTYEELLLRSDALGCALRGLDLEKGDRVGVWSHNTAAWVIAAMASIRAGLIPVAINPVYEKQELSFCIKKTGLKALVIGEKTESRDYYGTLRGFMPEFVNQKPNALDLKDFPTLKIIISPEKQKLPGVLSLDDLVSEYEKVAATKISNYGGEVGPDEGSIIHFTSGTTGDPKAALDSHFGLVNNAYYAGKRNLFSEGHHKICIQTPLFHALGSVLTMYSGFRHGASLVLASPTYNLSANLNALFVEKCTAITGTPTMFVDLVNKVREVGDSPPALRVAMAAGAPCSPQLIRDMQKYMNTEVKALFGMTETTGTVFQSAAGDSVETVAETVGYIQDHVEVKVVDENGKLVPFGSPGELLTRGYNTMIGYWDEPEKTRQALNADGWLRTGDKFTISEDGYGRIVGRIKDIIVRGGENIAPKEIEDLLNTHPNVVESQVVGISDERLGEEICAVLRVREGAKVSLEDVKKICDGQLAKFKTPRVLKIIDDFPKTGSGKIQKFKLKELIEAGKI